MRGALRRHRTMPERGLGKFMPAQEAIAKVLRELPPGMVRWGGGVKEDMPRLPSGLASVDRALGGGWVRGRLNVVRPGGGLFAEGAASTGRTTLALATVAEVTRTSTLSTSRKGPLAAWVDGDASLDPESARKAGVDLAHLLWVRGPLSQRQWFTAGDEILASGLFRLVVMGFQRGPTQRVDGANWLRLARDAERTRTTVLVVNPGFAGGIPGAVFASVGPVSGVWSGQAGPGMLLDGATGEFSANDRDETMEMEIGDGFGIG